jgi:hypothetical protein
MTKGRKLKSEIIADFDFEKVHKAMVAVDWKYSLPVPHIPDVDELKQIAEMLLDRVLLSGSGSARTGGFEAWLGDEEGQPIAGLKFWLERTESYVFMGHADGGELVDGRGGL